MKRYTEMMETAQKKAASQNKKPIAYEKWALFFSVSIPVMVFSFVSSSFLFFDLQASIVKTATQTQQAEAPSSIDLPSAFRLQGQEREEYITQKDQRDMSYEERLIYLEEYNQKRPVPTIKYYTTPDGEKVFMGYKPGKIDPTRIRNTQNALFYGGEYRGGSSARPALPRIDNLQQRVQEYIQQRRAERQEFQEQKAQSEQFLSSAPARPVVQADAIEDRLKAQLQVEREQPTVKLSYYQRAHPYSDIYRFMVLFSQDIEGFKAEDIRLENGEIHLFDAINNQTFIVDIQHKDKVAPLVVWVEEGRVYNKSDMGNTASNTIRIEPNQGPRVQVRALK